MEAIPEFVFKMAADLASSVATLNLYQVLLGRMALSLGAAVYRGWCKGLKFKEKADRQG